MSGRPRSIDRDKVLDAAEAIVARSGAAGLTFEAVAREAGITKGGVQYCFGSKENLIRAMILRWGAAFETEVMAHAGPDPSPQAVIRGHLLATRDTDEAEHSRSAAMMTALLESPDQVAESRAWYTQRLAGLDLTRAADRKVALGFLAGEGAFLLRALGLIELDEAQWQRLFADILELAGPRADGDEAEDGRTE
ncbi:TetR/AcrR family transcriptional regulator [Paracoccus siganidrum]|uniref:TetR/AcrR family transcriptional regulator n=1 Tax=Paracoccus siganidrum TaxID=1276757 RepID=A0A419AAM3_9RHOB|nr:TetR/AcrR family transcriptional regulator [Paracoccus siganidrum]RJL20121.1 TetR/AcrR family transcriptional regulator [Paracoccus siganidrum]RMC32548.1 TetR/AcrR family transcriptional regulator [Paracoccus siganidrum]